jgi:hypothetical protein
MSDEYEFEVKQLPLDVKLQAAVEALRDEGWTLNPAEGVPMITYHIMRKKGAIGPPPFEALFNPSMLVDDSKVFVRRPDGRILDAAGNEVDPTSLN